MNDKATRTTGEGSRQWQELIERDDRTPPTEYPDMALIREDELQDIVDSCADIAADALRDLEIVFNPPDGMSIRKATIAQAQSLIREALAK